MLSRNCVPIATTELLCPYTEVTPAPTLVSVTNIGYPGFNLVTVSFTNNPLLFGLTALKKNLIPNWPLVVVAAIPVMIPVNPSTFSIVVIFSVLNGGSEIITLGGLV